MHIHLEILAGEARDSALAHLPPQQTYTQLISRRGAMDLKDVCEAAAFYPDLFGIFDKIVFTEKDKVHLFEEVAVTV